MANSNTEFIFPDLLTTWKYKVLGIQNNKVSTIKAQEGL